MSDHSGAECLALLLVFLLIIFYLWFIGMRMAAGILVVILVIIFILWVLCAAFSGRRCGRREYFRHRIHRRQVAKMAESDSESYFESN